jgi:gamma-glutamyltranspeptidase / glutathione hydrolase
VKPVSSRRSLLCGLALLPAVLATVGTGLGTANAEESRSAATYRPEVLARVGVVAAGRHFAAEAGLRMLARGGNAVDAGVAAVFAAAVTEISHFGLGGEVPIVLYLADRHEVLVINGQGVAPAAASVEYFRRLGDIPGGGPLAGAVPAVVDALAIALAEFGTLSLADVLAPAITLAEDGFPWYDYLARALAQELDNVRKYPSGARVYLQGPGGTAPAVGSVFRQPDLARTLRALVEEEQRHLERGRKAAIHAARDRFYRGDVGQRIARAAQDAGGLLTADDLARYVGRVERPTHAAFRTRHGSFEVFKTSFWGQGPVLLQALLILQGFDLERMGHNSTEYIHTVTEALKLALADRDAFYGDPDFAKVPIVGLLSEAYAAERRTLIDPLRAQNSIRPGDPWKFQPRADAPESDPRRTGVAAGRGIASQRAIALGTPASTPAARGAVASVARPALSGHRSFSPDTTNINVADANGNLFSASPSSGWFFAGVFIAGDTGVPLGNRMQAFVLNEDGHPNLVQGGKRPRTTLTPTVVLRDGKPFLALSSPGGDSQDQQALQVLLNLAVFNMRPQEAIEAPRFNSLHHHQSFGRHPFGDRDGRPGVLQVEDRIPVGTIEALRRLGHRVEVLGPFMMDTGTTLAGVDQRHGTLFGGADVRRERFVVGW